MVKKIVSEQPLNFNSIFYIIPRVIVNYRTTFPGICYFALLFRVIWTRHITPNILDTLSIYSLVLLAHQNKHRIIDTFYSLFQLIVSGKSLSASYSGRYPGFSDGSFLRNILGTYPV